MDGGSQALTELLRSWSKGDREAGNEAFERILPVLRRVARSAIASWPRGSELHPTDLIQEAYLRLSKGDEYFWQNREQFIAVASLQMRRALLDEARKLSAGKRGRGWHRITFDERIEDPTVRSPEIERLMDALQKLAKKYPRRSTIVELRFFGGLTVERISRELGISTRTVKRDWMIARAWLFRCLRQTA